jgi:hypothetical protein
MTVALRDRDVVEPLVKHEETEHWNSAFTWANSS